MPLFASAIGRLRLSCRLASLYTRLFVLAYLRENWERKPLSRVIPLSVCDNMAVDSQCDSQETNSTSSVEDSLNITFENICYKVRHGFFAGGERTFT